jgi:hypothetical protein
MRPLSCLVLIATLWAGFLPLAYAQQDAVLVALVSLCDPSKIAMLSGDRAANPRVRKIAY